MSVYPTIHTRGLATVAASLAATFAFTGVAAAADPTWTKVAGNPNCADVGSGLRELKIDPVPQGRKTFGDGSFGGAITVAGRVFDWSSSQGVDVVIVKGGPNAAIYRYSPEATGGRGLRAPTNPSNGQPYGLSHITFCHDVEMAPPAPAPTPPQTTPVDSPSRTEGNPDCADVGGASLRQLKIDPVPQGRTAFGDGTLAGSILVDDVYFDWSGNQGVDIVIVKGGPNATVYRSAAEMSSGTRLHAPINPSNGRPYGLSHITYCYDVEPAPQPQPEPCTEGGATTMPNGEPCREEEPEPQPEPCTEGGPTTMPNGEACQQEQPKPEPCTPGGATTMPNGEPCGGTSSTPPVTTTTTTVTPNPAPAPAPAITVASRQPQGSSDVLGAVGRVTRRVAANATMQGPRRCVARPFKQTVRGKGIRRVSVFVNGRRVRTLTGAGTVRINPRAYRSGVMRITARVEFVAASRRRPQTLRWTVLRCAQQQAAPQVRFAG